MVMDLGLQLYSVRKSLLRNWKKTLEAVAETGFKLLQITTEDGVSHTAGNIPAAEMKAFLNTLGMHISQIHVKTSEHTDWNQVFRFADELECQELIVPMGIYREEADVVRTADSLNLWCERCEQAGKHFGYHNHVQEFRIMSNGHTLLDNLFSALDKRIILELDVYWAVRGGQNPVDLLNRYGNRCSLIHLKDLPEKTKPVNIYEIYGAEAYIGMKELIELADPELYTESGKGMLSMPEILDAFRANGGRAAFVEQDQTLLPELESIRASYGYLKTFFRK